MVEICKKHGAYLMMDEAHSVGVLGKTGRGIEEHFGLEDVIDIKMGTLSKTIPSVGGYVAGKKDLITYLRHASRGVYFFRRPSACPSRRRQRSLQGDPRRALAHREIDPQRGIIHQRTEICGL